MQFQAAATDVKNILGLTTESLNQLWDRTDSLLDYSWKEGENEKDRGLKLELAKMELQAAKMAADAKKKSGLFAAIGTIGGAIVGGMLGGPAGAAAGASAGSTASDERLKTNIEHYNTLADGTKLYTWDWTEEAVSRGLDKSPNYGVLAQEIQDTHPDAVRMASDGYLRVNYGKVAI
jgi:hypothetical protein